MQFVYICLYIYIRYEKNKTCTYNNKYIVFKVILYVIIIIINVLYIFDTKKLIYYILYKRSWTSSPCSLRYYNIM